MQVWVLDQAFVEVPSLVIRVTETCYRVAFTAQQACRHQILVTTGPKDGERVAPGSPFFVWVQESHNRSTSTDA